MNITDEMVERAARALASIAPGEDWPSNEALGGNATGTRDDEYRDGMRDMARAALEAALIDEDAEYAIWDPATP